MCSTLSILISGKCQWVDINIKVKTPALTGPLSLNHINNYKQINTKERQNMLGNVKHFRHLTNEKTPKKFNKSLKTKKLGCGVAARWP